MKETGRVVSVGRGFATVEFVPKEACEHCGSRGFCRPSPGKMTAEALNHLGARPGDEVCMETDVGSSVLAASLVFLVPIAGLIAGYVLARAIWDSEAAGTAGAFSLMAAFTGILAYLDRRVLRPKRFMPRISAILGRGVDRMAKDPVCGMDVSEKSDYKTVHGGITYQFCCEACKLSFEKKPDEYLKRL